MSDDADAAAAQVPSDAEPPVVDPYEVLGLDRTATPDQIKAAYRKAALKNHPDKVAAAQKKAAHAAFQRIALAYAVLSDPARRKRYDVTGSTADSILGAGAFDWADFYRDQFANAVSPAAIEQVRAAYRGSDEERADLLAAYTLHRGNMDAVYETVMLSDVLADDARFRRIIDAAVARGQVAGHRAYTRESARSRAARTRAARAEAAEAEEHAKQLGLHDRLFGRATPTAGAGAAAAGEPADALAALIRGRQKERADGFFQHLADKYGSSSEPCANKKKKRNRAPDEEEPDEAAFQAAAARLGPRKSKASEDPPSKAASKKSRR